jgi:hypothetical protein
MPATRIPPNSNTPNSRCNWAARSTAVWSLVGSIRLTALSSLRAAPALSSVSSTVQGNTKRCGDRRDVSAADQCDHFSIGGAAVQEIGQRELVMLTIELDVTDVVGVQDRRNQEADRQSGHQRRPGETQCHHVVTAYDNHRPHKNEDRQLAEREVA